MMYFRTKVQYIVVLYDWCMCVYFTYESTSVRVWSRCKYLLEPLNEICGTLVIRPPRRWVKSLIEQSSLVRLSVRLTRVYLKKSKDITCSCPKKPHQSIIFHENCFLRTNGNRTRIQQRDHSKINTSSVSRSAINARLSVESLYLPIHA